MWLDKTLNRRSLCWIVSNLIEISFIGSSVEYSSFSTQEMPKHFKFASSLHISFYFQLCFKIQHKSVQWLKKKYYKWSFGIQHLLHFDSFDGQWKQLLDIVKQHTTSPTLDIWLDINLVYIKINFKYSMIKREFPMSLNDTTFHVIAQTPTRHLPKKYLTMFFTPYCSLA